MTRVDVPVSLIEELVSMFATGGKVAIPPGRRDEVVGLLTRLMINPEFRNAYGRAVTAVRERLGVDRAMMCAGDSGEIPEREIARFGFGGLTDERLADYAASPAAVEAIAERLYDDDLLAELGDWFLQAAEHERLAGLESAG